jgi:hypothetical protein
MSTILAEQEICAARHETHAIDLHVRIGFRKVQPDLLIAHTESDPVRPKSGSQVRRFRYELYGWIGLASIRNERQRERASQLSRESWHSSQDEQGYLVAHLFPPGTSDENAPSNIDLAQRGDTS